MRKKILIIDDDQWFADILSTTLAEGGFETKWSAHVIDAMSDIDDFLPDVIISDILLVGSTAFNLFNELQSHSDLSKIPIIICSNLGGQLDIGQLTPYGVQAVLEKATMRPGDLRDAINGCLSP